LIEASTNADVDATKTKGRDFEASPAAHRVARRRLAFGVRFALDPVLNDRAPFLLFTLAVVAASVVGGAAIGLFATVVSAMAANYIFVPPRGSLYPQSAEYALEAASFIAISVSVSLLAGRMRDARVRAEAGEAELRRLHRNLEALVAERTADLEVANKQLEGLHLHRFPRPAGAVEEHGGLRPHLARRLL
jgi:K+-sensing histidine kinase KdpD